MEALKQALQELLAQAGANTSFGEVMELFVQALKAHPEALGALEGSYRMQTTDTGVSTAFALSENGLELLDADAKTDAAISGSEADLMAVIRKELNPMAAMFMGKLKIQGSMQALAKFAQIL